MGSSGGGGGPPMPTKSTQMTTRSAASAAPIAPTVQTPTTEVITPAVGRDINQDTKLAQQNQSLARSRLTGIRSTWSSFGGSKSNLGG